MQLEDRSKNLMIFGLTEYKRATVGKLFETISEKPKIEVYRLVWKNKIRGQDL